MTEHTAQSGPQADDRPTSADETYDTARRPRIVVGVDGSQSSRLALEWAVRLARAEGAFIDAILAWDYPTSYGWSGVPSELPWREDAEKQLIATIDAVFGRSRPEGLHLQVVRGDPAHVLISASDDALMVIVGSRGHGGFAGLLIGSVSAKIAELSHRPVLVVHDPAIAENETSPRLAVAGSAPTS